jgi:hypothetical protein
MIEYLYTGELSAKPSDLLETLQAADLYQLDHMKSICERKIERYVDTENVLYMFQMADKFKAPWLKGFCLKAIVKSHPKLHGTEPYQMLDPDLHSEIVRALNNE